MTRFKTRIYNAIFVCCLVVATIKSAKAQEAAVIMTQTNLSGGTFRYDYRIDNLSDPIAFAGYDLYDVTFILPTNVSVQVGASPPGWTDIVTPDYLEVFSVLAGAPPVGTDIAPGSRLSGFWFESNRMITDLSFDATFTNPNDSSNPVVFSGSSQFTSSVVPEPTTLILIGSSCLLLMSPIRRRTTP